MASFISTLSLLILVLVNGYFAIPIVDESLTTPFPSLPDGLTTELVAHLHLMSDDEASKSLIEHKRMIDESQTTTSSGNLLSENIARALHKFDKLFTYESSTSTTERPSIPENEFKDLSSTHRIERQQRDIRSDSDDGTNPDPEPEPEPETETEKDEENTIESETKVDKRDMPIESTTAFTTSFTSTTQPSTSEPSTTTLPTTTTSSSTTTTTLLTIPTTMSTLVPQFTTLETTTKKYIGLLKDDKESEEIIPESFKKPNNEQPTETKFKPDDTSNELVKTKPIQKPKVPSDDEYGSSARVAVALYDQDEINKLPTVPSGIMVLDEHNDVVIPGVSNKFSPTDIKDKEERKQLNQGEKPAYSEEEKSNH